MGGFFLALALVAVGFIIFLVIKRLKDIASLELEHNPNIFEQGEKSVKMCTDEILVRAYNCTQLKSVFLRMMKARGILTITNKRVIFHTIGVKNDDDFIHHEVPIADVSSVTVQNGVAKESVMNIFTPLFALLPFGKVKKIFYLNIHAKGVSGDEGAISVAPTDAKGMTVAVPSYDMIPTEIVIEMANEIGAMISDVQMYGDIGVEKWKQSA